MISSLLVLAASYRYIFSYIDTVSSATNTPSTYPMLALIYTTIENMNAHPELHKEESGRTDSTNSFAQNYWDQNLTLATKVKVIHVVIVLGSYSACYIYTFAQLYSSIYTQSHTQTVHILSRQLYLKKLIHNCTIQPQKKKKLAQQ